MQTSSDIPPLPSGHALGITADKPDRSIDRLSEGAHETVDRVAETLGSAAQVLSEKGGQWRTTGERWSATSRDTIARHPLASLATAVVAGVLISRLTSRHH